MATVLESLKGINAYPIPLRILVTTAERHGLSFDTTATKETMNSKGYKLSEADLLLWLSLAPNISQGGQTYSFTDEQRQSLRKQGQALYESCGEEAAVVKSIYGYKGSRL